MPLRAQCPDHLKSVNAGQHDVEYEKVERRFIASEERQRLLTRFSNGDFKAFGFQIETQSFREMLFIFNDQDAGHTGMLLFTEFADKSLATSTVKGLPWPAPALSAYARPPCLRATARTMKSPRPVPF